MLDEHGHLIVDHDLDYIAEKFVEFAKRQRYDFWKEGYKYKLVPEVVKKGTGLPSEISLAAEREEDYEAKRSR